jgi:hypothetical protein
MHDLELNFLEKIKIGLDKSIIILDERSIFYFD